MTSQMNFEQARLNMIEQQIRPWEVLDQTVLDLLQLVHREDFVPEEFRQLALADITIPLANEQVMMTPKLEARLLQALDIQTSDKILEVGTGSGYLTALLAKLGSQVESIDIFEDFTNSAKKVLATYDLDNTRLETRDFFQDREAGKVYDVVVITGSMPSMDSSLNELLTVGGRLFVIVGESPVMEARLIRRVSEAEWQEESLFETELPPLVGVEVKSEFEF